MKINFGIILFLAVFYGVVAKSVDLEKHGPHDKHTTEDESSKSRESCLIENQQMPHEKKCNLYYRCVYGIKVIKECPDRMLFNPQKANCDSSYNVGCGLLESPEDNSKYNWYYTEDYSTSDISETNEKTTTPKSLECPETLDPFEPNPSLPHEEICNVYYKCRDGKKYLMKCPGMLQFNPKVLVCDWPINVRCIDKRAISSTESTEQASTKTSDRSKENIKKTDSSEENIKKTDSSEESVKKLVLKD